MVFVASDNLGCSFTLPEVLQGRPSLSRFRLQDQPCSTAAGQRNGGVLCPGVGHTPAPVWSGMWAERRQVCVSHTVRCRLTIAEEVLLEGKGGYSGKRRSPQMSRDVHPLLCILSALKHRLRCRPDLDCDPSQQPCGLTQLLGGHLYKVEHSCACVCVYSGLSSKSGAGTIARGPNPPCSLLYKSPYTFVYVLSTAAFSPQWQSWVATGPLGFAKPKMYTVP